MLGEEVPVYGVGLGVLEALVSCELDGDAHQLEGREVGPREVLGRAPVDDGSGQLGE